MIELDKIKTLVYECYGIEQIAQQSGDPLKRLLDWRGSSVISVEKKLRELLPNIEKPSPDYVVALFDALSESPIDKHFLMRLGLVLKLNAMLKESQQLYEYILEIDPTDLYAQRELCFLHSQKSDFRIVIKYADSIVSSTSDFEGLVVHALRLRALSHLEIGDNKSAIRDATTLIKHPKALAKHVYPALKIRISAYRNTYEYAFLITDVTTLLGDPSLKTKDRILYLNLRANAHNKLNQYILALNDVRTILDFTEDGNKPNSSVYGIMAQAYTGLALQRPAQRREFFVSAREACAKIEDSDNLVALYIDAKIDFYEGDFAGGLTKARQLIQRSDSLMYKVLYVLLAPESDALLAQTHIWGGEEQFSRIKKIADQWRENGREPESPFPPYLGGGTVFDGVHSRPVNREALADLKSL